MVSEKNINDINQFLQNKLNEQELSEVSAVDAAYWLDEAGILKDTKDRPGKPLRDLLRDNKINNAIQKNARFWFILRTEH